MLLSGQLASLPGYSSHCVAFCFLIYGYNLCHFRLLTNFESGVPRRDFSKVTDNQATELYFEEIFEQGYATGDPLFDLRNYFYPESEVLYNNKKNRTFLLKLVTLGSSGRTAQQCRQCG